MNQDKKLQSRRSVLKSLGVTTAGLSVVAGPISAKAKKNPVYMTKKRSINDPISQGELAKFHSQAQRVYENRFGERPKTFSIPNLDDSSLVGLGLLIEPSGETKQLWGTVPTEPKLAVAKEENIPDPSVLENAAKSRHNSVEQFASEIPGGEI
jgi:hypothetical protein